MQPIQTPIIPRQPTFSQKVVGPHQWNKEGICVFTATSFGGKDTYWKDEVVLPPASHKMNLNRPRSFNK